MPNLKITLVSSTKNPKGYVVSSDDLSLLIEMADLSIKEEIEKLWVISSDVSLEKAKQIAKQLSLVSSNDLLIVGHSDANNGFSVSYGKIDSFNEEKLLYLAPLADQKMVSRIYSFFSAKIAETPDLSSKKWYEIIVKVQTATGLDWKKNLIAKEENNVVALPSKSVMVNGYFYKSGEVLKVDSSAIKELSYQVVSKTLTITFTSNMTYNYYNVPLNIFDELVSSNSVGKYHHRYIKNEYENEIVYEGEILNFKLQSSVLSEVSHVGSTMILTFVSGQSYKYFSVPRSVVLKLMSSSKASNFFRENIKSFYQFEKI